ncbi:LPS export ABC transporter periplasmic protein LptC [Mucilaginibacter boryungensis]|uniref:LPS export ABC transporter periplasmic protein LptC n=1 Tax=Mucilaginibacter boryungensis TaxID=768480 RepID=A0ABR9XKZ9_9SPHI|nr:LPS export ABC transporter periplasmic protein LptC [Mucilaginibacter boryungensis]MBE9667925.1 LPS export ABC transporter periplasmic protein LptC [Mucilaginibacter boryungensis]
MYRRVNYLLCFLLSASLGLMLLSACTNDLKKIREISAKEVNSPADTTRGVDVIFSDSAKVKARLITPLMLEYPISKDNKEIYRKMPKGLKVIFFDKDHKESGTIVADTGYNYEARQLIFLKKNVVITSAKGDVFKSDELNWNMATHQITSNKPIDIRMANGNILHATAMETNEKFDPYVFKNQTGLIYVNRNLDQ